jgi:hypothetical protein
MDRAHQRLTATALGRPVFIAAAAKNRGLFIEVDDR